MCVLTDGSGHSATSRLSSSARLIAAAGAFQGPIFGPLTDRALYDAIRRGDAGRFESLARTLAALIVERRPSLVFGDAAEGFNPGHDICRFAIDAAVALAARHGQIAANLEFVLDAAPEAPSFGAAGGARCLTLDDDALDRKLAVARTYVELRADVDSALARYGREAFRHEWLRPPTTAQVVASWDAEPPYYERHGRARVAQGIYPEPLTWADHVRPVYACLRRLVEAPSCAFS